MSRIEDLTDEVVKMNRAGLPIITICAELDIHPPQVYMALAKAGEPRRERVGGRVGDGHVETPELFIKRWKGRGLTEATLGQILRMHEEDGRDAKEISDTLRMPYSRVLDVLRDARVQLNPGNQRQWKKIRAEAIEALTNEPERPVDDIALAFGLQPGSGSYKMLIKVARFRREWVVASKLSKQGKVESIVEEVVLRLREEYGLDMLGRLAASAGTEGVQLRLDLGDEDMLIGTPKTAGLKDLGKT